MIGENNHYVAHFTQSFGPVTKLIFPGMYCKIRKLKNQDINQILSVKPKHNQTINPGIREISGSKIPEIY